MAALRFTARKLAGGGRASIQAVMGSPPAAAAAVVEEGQRPLLSRLLIYGGGSPASRRFSSGASDSDPPPNFISNKYSLRYLIGPPPGVVDKAELEALKMEVEQKKEELFYKLAMLDWQWKSRRRSKEGYNDRELIYKLIGHIKPNPDDQLWRRYNFGKKLNICLAIGIPTVTVLNLVALYQHAVG